MRSSNRTTLLINCSVEEAGQIRAAARRDDRTISAYILRAVKARLRLDMQIAERQRDFLAQADARARTRAS